MEAAVRSVLSNQSRVTTALLVIGGVAMVYFWSTTVAAPARDVVYVPVTGPGAGVAGFPPAQQQAQTQQQQQQQQLRGTGEVGPSAANSEEAAALRAQIAALQQSVSELTGVVNLVPAAPAQPALQPPPPQPVVAPAPPPPPPSAEAGQWLATCKTLWKRKVDEFVKVRDARRALAAARPPVQGTPWADAKQMLRAFFFDPFDPEWSCDTKRKIGTPTANGNDGPKWTCGIHLFKQPCIIFSLGCNNLIDFESEMYKWGQCTIHVFDPTVDGSIAPSLKQQAGATLHLLGLGTPGQRLGNGELKDLKGLMGAAGVNGHLDVLKIDVEGFEWAPLLQVFKDLSEHKMSVGQMQVELHTMLDGARHYLNMDDQASAMLGVRRLFDAADAAGMMLFSKEPNTAWCGGQDCGEWSWISTRFALEEHIGGHCPAMLPHIGEFAAVPLPPFPNY